MGKRRSMMRAKKYDDAYDRKMIRPWSNLTHDVLSLVMMKLGVVDFLAFNRVCKSWRSLAVSNRNKFIVSKPPMFIYKNLYYHLEDFERRKLKTIVSHAANRICIGITCGYLILYGEKTNDFWLVNLITRHELHFPNVPNIPNVPGKFFCFPGFVSAILVFSPSLSGWVFVVSNSCFYNKIWFSIAGKREWTYVSTPFPIRDLIAFKGKVYTLHSSYYPSRVVRLSEMKLYPDPELVLLETESFPKPDFKRPGFVTSGENLYVIDRYAKHPHNIHELDVDEMKWVSRENTDEEYDFFRSKSVYAYAPDPSLYDGRYVVANKNGWGWSFYGRMWYILSDCFNVDIIHE